MVYIFDFPHPHTPRKVANQPGKAKVSIQWTYFTITKHFEWFSVIFHNESIFIKVMNFHQKNKFSSILWIFIILKTCKYNHELLPNIIFSSEISYETWASIKVTIALFIRMRYFSSEFSIIPDEKYLIWMYNSMVTYISLR